MKALKRLLASCVLVLAFYSLSWAAAATVVITENGTWLNNYKELKYVCTSSDAGGGLVQAATVPTTTVPSNLWGSAWRIDRVIYEPHATAVIDNAANIYLQPSVANTANMLGGLLSAIADATAYKFDVPVTTTNGAPVIVTQLPVVDATACGNTNIFTLYILLKKLP